MSTISTPDLDLNRIAESFNPDELDDQSKRLLIQQGLPGAREMFEAQSVAAKKQAKMDYIRATLLHEE